MDFDRFYKELAENRPIPTQILKFLNYTKTNYTSIKIQSFSKIH